jgi:hypothetical protein
MRCASCHKVIDSKNAWKSSSGCFYCSEFCADSENSAPDSENSAPIDQHTQKQLIDRQYVDRLQRLLPLVQSLQASR